MILAVDVQYRETVAVAAGVLFAEWGAARAAREVVATIEIHSPYRPGEFYLRELPCILELLRHSPVQPECIVIDGYVFLDGYDKPGLGKRLFDALGGAVPVIGVAKNPFRGIGGEFRLYRGRSRKPLYITAAGVDLGLAKGFIAGMHGWHRIPTLLKEVDRLSRTLVADQR